MLKKIGMGLAAVGTAAAATGGYLRFIRPWHLRWGATDEEVPLFEPADFLSERKMLLSIKQRAEHASRQTSELNSVGTHH